MSDTDTATANKTTIQGGPSFRTDIDPQDGAHVQVNKVHLGDIDSFEEGYVGANNPMPTGAGAASTGNSSTATLAGAATFTGTGEQNNHSDVMVSCYSDTSGTLYFDFSVNGTDWRTFPSSGFAVAGGIHEFHTAVKGPRYFRVRFVNGASAQSTFQLSTYYGTYRQPSAPLNQPLGLDSDAILTRSSLPWLDVTRGLVSGMSYVKKFGRNPAVGTTFVPICQGGVYQTPQSSAATTLRIKAGGDANDTAAGSGAREVTLEGTDENFEFAMEAVATNGASASSATTTTFTRLYRAYVTESGTYASASAGSHAGSIVIENGSGGTDWGTIDQANIGFSTSQSEIGAYTVAAGYTAYVFPAKLLVDSSKTTDVVFFHRGGADETAAPYTAMRAKSIIGPVTGVNFVDMKGEEFPYGPFTGPCDIGFMAKVSATTSDVTVEFEIVLVQE